MFEKKIKNFFNSVTICGEEPTKKGKLDQRILVAAEIFAGVAVAVSCAGFLMFLMDKVGEEIPDDAE